MYSAPYSEACVEPATSHLRVYSDVVHAAPPNEPPSPSELTLIAGTVRSDRSWPDRSQNAMPSKTLCSGWIVL